MRDLIKFQIFLLTTRDNLEDLKSDKFDYNWKNFFVENIELQSRTSNYFYDNPITEKDPFSWATKTIWFGRFTEKFKTRPETLQESKPLAISEINNISS